MATVPTSHTFTSGVGGTSEMNAYVRDVFDFLQNVPAAELRQTSAQTFTTATITAVQFNAEDLDDDPAGTGGHDNVTNNTRYTAVYPGWYRVAGGMSFAANATGDRYCWWRVNGSDLNASLSFIPADASAINALVARTKLVFLNVGDYVELIAYQDSGGNLNSSVSTREQPSMSVIWVRQA